MCNTSEVDIGVIFDGSFEGFLTIIYDHYYEKLNPVHIILEDGFQQLINTFYINIITDNTKSNKVLKALKIKISKANYYTLEKAFLSEDESRFINMYNYILLGFKVGEDVSKYLNYDYVLSIEKLSRYVNREAHAIKEFCRFRETKDGIYYSDISPINNVIYLVSKHFEDRFKGHNFIIHDVKRSIAVIYDGKKSTFTQVPKDVNIVLSENEELYQKLWVKFFHTIAIEERKNPKCQNTFLPKRYRKHMTEFIRKDE